MKKLITVLIVIVVVVAGIFYFAGTKKKSDTSSQSQSSSKSDNTSKPPVATTQAADKVTIDGFAFSPASITVKKGTTVTWTNQDGAAHTVVETDGQNGPNSDRLEKGQSYSFTYTATGTYKYHCSIHPDMTGTVTVTE